MEFVEVVFELSPEDKRAEYFIAELFEAGADGVWEDPPVIKAYIPKDQFSKEHVDNMLMVSADFANIKWQSEALADINWNAEWEKHYPVAEITQECRIIGPFHEAKAVAFEILVAPKMAFGTGHHDTTSMVMQAMLQRREAFPGVDVADVGCGTGVLGILASKLGAKSVVAIDYDQWSVDNSNENVGLNSVVNMAVELGDSKRLAGRSFQVILANINRNILLEQLPDYAASCRSGGQLYLSGFMESDIELLDAKASSVGFSNRTIMRQGDWRAMIYDKA